MKKIGMFILSTVMAVSVGSFTNAKVANAACSHDWKYSDTGYMPTQYGEHEFWHKHDDGSTYHEKCQTMRNSWKFTRKCTKCGSTETENKSEVTHTNSHCPSSH